MNRLKRIALTGLAALTMSLGAAKGLEAATLRVPSQYSTIQSAIDAASDGDEVLVAPGTYYDHPVMPNISLTLKSESGPEDTIFGDSGGEYIPWRIVIPNGIDSNRNFTIDGFSFKYNYGISIGSPVTVIVRNNIMKDSAGCIGLANGGHVDIIGNYLDSWRRNIGIDRGTANIYNNLIKNVFGDGIYIGTSDPVDIRNNTFIGYESGARAITNGNPTTTFSNNIFQNLRNTGGYIVSPDITNLGCNDFYIDNTVSIPNLHPTDIKDNPLFCDSNNNDYKLHSNSPCLPENNSCGLIGALGVGCVTTPTKKTSWGELKVKYR